MISSNVTKISAVFQIPLAELGRRLGAEPGTLLDSRTGGNRQLLRRLHHLAEIADLVLKHLDAEDIPMWARTPLPAIDGLSFLDAISAGRELEVGAGLRDALSM